MVLKTGHFKKSTIINTGKVLKRELGEVRRYYAKSRRTETTKR